MEARFIVILRKCVKCGLEATNEEELELFVNNPPSKYGKQNLCKICHIEKCREGTRRYRENHPDRYKEKRNASCAKWRAENPEKKHAQNLTKRVPLDNKCFVCGSTENLERHHFDYDKPRQFTTLCRECHVKEHSETWKMLEVDI